MAGSLQMNIHTAANIDDLAKLARRRLPRVIWDFLEGGAEDERTLLANRVSFDLYRFKPRILAGNGKRDLSIELFGHHLAAPFLIGPTGLNGIYRPDADIHLSRAAAASGIGFAVSTASNNSMEDIAATGKAVRFFQLYPWGDRKLSARLLERAQAAGYNALILTADSLIPGNRERDVRNRFAHSVHITPQFIFDGLSHPRWLVSTWFKRGMPRLENIAEFLPPKSDAYALARYTRSQRNEWFSWSDVSWVREHWKGPLIIKGVLTSQDARIARTIGANGIIVSNHGGRALDGAISTLEALPAIAADSDDMVVLLDGGIRRGTDIIKAIALGAQAVLLGRATLYGLIAGGESGVAKAIGLLRSEVDRAMGLLGCTTVSDIGSHLLCRLDDIRPHSVAESV
jgi:(S)-mandelate dehydrogenase